MMLNELSAYTATSPRIPRRINQLVNIFYVKELPEGGKKGATTIALRYI